MAFFFELRQRYRKMNSLMRAQFIALRRLGTALLFKVKVMQGVAEFEELRSLSVQLQATEGEPNENPFSQEDGFLFVLFIFQYSSFIIHKIKNGFSNE